jgi:ketosteroid isomerase-like protein
VSQENVEIVREVMALVGNGDGDPSERLTDLVAADAQIDRSRRAFNPDRYYGSAGLRRLAREVREVWKDYRVSPDRFVDAGDRVVVIETMHGREEVGGAEVERRSAVIWTLRDGQVIRMQSGFEPQEALKAVGLEG